MFLAVILLQLHNLFWLADFLLPNCCHEDIIAQPTIKSISKSSVELKFTELFAKNLQTQLSQICPWL